MKAFILAAGESTRLRPLTAYTPKPLLKVAGKPFLQHTIDALKGAGIKDIIILVGWRNERLREYFGDGKRFGVRITYEEQVERLGTAHAVSFAKSFVDDEFLCLNGDIVVGTSLLRKLLEFYDDSKENVMTLVEVENPERYGVVEVENGIVMDIKEKPTVQENKLINAGIYIFNSKIFDAINRTEKSARGEYEITDSLRLLIKEGVRAFITDEFWADIGFPWDLLRANEIFLRDVKSDIKGKVESFATIEGNLVLGENSIVRNGAYIKGNVIIGENCDIGPNCLIRGYTSIGDNCKVGNAVEVKNSIIMDNTKIPHHNYVGDSIIGENCNLGSGTKVANLRLDERELRIIIKGKKVDTGRRKLGVIMGDNVKTGINSSIDVGTIIGENSLIGPNAIVKGCIAPNSRVY